ncbi:hypothetical protein J4410_03490 [Candidatus Woesearchaeota archaeon]|nr:hypothetical protein [Candidatus Woesearchaeota archaeon]
MNYLIGISGGSGSGKSTLAYGLQERFPDLIEVVHFDDYQKMKEQVPVRHGISNWDHPEAIDFEGLLRDLKLLKSGKDVNVMTKSAKHNPEYKKIGRVPYIMKAKKIIIIEGYMSITDKRIRELCNFTVFLDLDTNERMKRRTKFINIGYREKILLPMHKEHVEPTKGFANMIIDVEKYNDKEIQELVINQLKILKVL